MFHLSYDEVSSVAKHKLINTNSLCLDTEDASSSEGQNICFVEWHVLKKKSKHSDKAYITA